MSFGAAFNGNITEIPNISVDNFTNQAVKAYFLSHTHTDHTCGLYDVEFAQALERNDAFIYMSEVSAAIVKYEFKNRCPLEKTNIVDRIKVLNLETESIILPEDPGRRIKETLLLVTMVPAGHSFGSVMFLFRANLKTILYTGDFRISTSDVSKFSQLHDKDRPIKIDTIYVDTTFINVEYTNFPKRTVSVEAVLSDIEEWLKKGEDNRVAIQTSAKYGYEYVFNEVYKKLGHKVYVENGRWRELYSHLTHLVSGVTNTSSRIHLCSSRRKLHYNCIPFEDVRNLKFLHIKLSAMKWRCYEVDDNPINIISECEIDVCFSTHCSRTELRYFIHYFNPKKIVGFPNAYDGNSPRKKCSDVFCVSPKKRKVVNDDKKMDRKALKDMFDL